MKEIINPITEKLLNGELNLSEITLEQFREGRTIYSTMKEARMKGFEAHHIVPRSLQGENVIDDRCIRYTAFEHIIDHYLMAKENPDYTYLFYCMINYNEKRCDLSEQEMLNKCIEVGKLREDGRKQMSNSKLGQIPWNKGKLNIYSDETLKKFKSRIFSEETRKKMSDSAKKRIHTPMSEETKQKIRMANTGKKLSEETIRKISNSKKSFYKNMTPEEYSEWLKNRKPMSEETKQKISKNTVGKRSGENNPMFGKKQSELSKLKNSESNKQYKWFTDGKNNVRKKECPPGFYPGRTI